MTCPTVPGPSSRENAFPRQPSLRAACQPEHSPLLRRAVIIAMLIAIAGCTPQTVAVECAIDLDRVAHLRLEIGGQLLRRSAAIANGWTHDGTDAVLRRLDVQLKEALEPCRVIRSAADHLPVAVPPAGVAHAGADPAAEWRQRLQPAG